jgi:nucleoid-associated protein YgaU
MGLFSFIQGVGKRLGLGTTATEADAEKAATPPPPPSADMLQQEINKLGIPFDGTQIRVEGDTVVLEGAPADAETREKLILAVGNVVGVARVDDRTEAEPTSVFYTVKKGDTLSHIAKDHYANANAYMKIFEANRPMLDHPDKIYPGQVLRIPPQAA